eukprot:gnl/TRDRNA2_/TRDRNA2_181057_c0_seq1.p1 gnl/TRDRNA2_/TRDRNA2_181057_c0~~gnl/TRDRNA2_/TRDRNA2_181057_c0_seq1.p1  ORF type:complete len:223 (+),score=50.71 gnl/TRDRNA2_/TRDRNA2_181057_c0_seq1:119-787(+)
MTKLTMLILCGLLILASAERPSHGVSLQPARKHVHNVTQARKTNKTKGTCNLIAVLTDSACGTDVRVLSKEMETCSAETCTSEGMIELLKTSPDAVDFEEYERDLGQENFEMAVQDAAENHTPEPDKKDYPEDKKKYCSCFKEDDEFRDTFLDFELSATQECNKQTCLELLVSAIETAECAKHGHDTPRAECAKHGWGDWGDNADIAGDSWDNIDTSGGDDW